jgi:curved DNA-binding protein
MDFKDYYATLGVPKTASEKEIKQSFRKLARKFHPDVNPGDKAAETKFKEINEAYEVLGDAGSRKKYDELGSNWRMYEQAEAQGQPSPFGGWSQPGGGTGYRTMTPEEMNEMFGDSNPFSDFFTTFFGSGGGRADGARPRSRAGRDVEHELQLSLEDAYTGTTRRLWTFGSPPAYATDRGSECRTKANRARDVARPDTCTCECVSRRIRRSN